MFCFQSVKKKHKQRKQNNKKLQKQTKKGKGSAVQFVCSRLQVDPENVIACGDSGNDISMLNLPKFHGVIVANSSNELLTYYDNFTEEKKQQYLYRSNKDRTQGVIEGLEHFAKKLKFNSILIKIFAIKIILNPVLIGIFAIKIKLKSKYK